MTDRTCSNCACYVEQILNPAAPPQSMCRRNGPIPAQIRIERPKLNPLTKEAMVSKVDHKPLMEVTTENVFVYAPTGPDKVCFDGWRTIGAEPGETLRTAFIKERMNALYGRFLTPENDKES
jgi:hypothetical protein